MHRGGRHEVTGLARDWRAEDALLRLTLPQLGRVRAVCGRTDSGTVNDKKSRAGASGAWWREEDCSGAGSRGREQEQGRGRNYRQKQGALSSTAITEDAVQVQVQVGDKWNAGEYRL